MRFVKDQQYCFYRYNRDLEANWKILLSDGSIVYQDDVSSTWSNLQEYCREKRVWPIHLTLEYYDNVLNILPPNAEGYFYRQGILTEFMCSMMGGDAPLQGRRSKTAIIGYFKEDTLFTYTIMLPELRIWDSGPRDKIKMAQDGILNDKSLFLIQTCKNPTAIPANIQTEDLQRLNT